MRIPAVTALAVSFLLALAGAAPATATEPSPSPPAEHAEPDVTAPVITAFHGKRRVRERRPWVMRVTIDEPATLGINWWRGRDVVAFKKIRAEAGTTVVRLGPRRLDAGPHRVTVVARDAVGNLSDLATRRLRVLPR